MITTMTSLGRFPDIAPAFGAARAQLRRHPSSSAASIRRTPWRLPLKTKTIVMVAFLLLSGAGSAAAGPVGEGPVPLLVGTWQSQAPNNNYVMRVNWNAATLRYEGVMVRQGYLSAQSGVMPGEVCWIASPVINQPYLQGAEEIRRPSAGGVPRPQWRPGPVRLDPRNPNVLIGGAGRFVRIGASAPIVPVRAGTSPPDDALFGGTPASLERRGENPALEREHPVADPQPQGPVGTQASMAGPGRAEAAPENPSDCERSFDGCPWMKELPSAFTVTKTFPGPDGDVQQEATFDALVDYIETRTGLKRKAERGWNPIVFRYLRAYLQALDPNGGGSFKRFGLTAAGKQIFDDIPSRIAVLSKVLPKPSVDWYASNSPAVRGYFSDKESARIESGRAVHAAKEDKEKAQHSKVDLSVFGIPLGEPFPIPDCPKIDIFTMSTAEVNEARATKATMDVCRVEANAGFLNMASQMIMDPEGLGYSEVTLAPSKRPPWVNSVGMLMKEGVVMAVTIATTDEDRKEQINALRSKYGKPQSSSVDNVLEWRLPGIYVQFRDRSSIAQPTQYIGGNRLGNAMLNVGSVMGRAQTPNLFIMLESVHKSQTTRKAAKRAAEPKL